MMMPPLRFWLALWGAFILVGVGLFFVSGGHLEPLLGALISIPFVWLMWAGLDAFLGDE